MKAKRVVKGRWLRSVNEPKQEIPCNTEQKFYHGKRQSMNDLLEAIAEFKAKLPGWWFTLGECSVSCDATVGPDVAHCPKWMLNAFDAGFDCDIRQPSTLAEALRGATEEALKAIDEFERNTTSPPERRRV